MQIINGIKTFKHDLIIDGDVVAPRINNVDIIKEYDAGVQNIDGDVEIFGDLVSTILKESLKFFQIKEKSTREDFRKITRLKSTRAIAI